MKVYIKKTKVELPYDPDKILLNLSSGTKAKAPSKKIEGQSIETVSHKMRMPIKIPTTCIPDALRPSGAGTYLIPNMKIKAMMSVT